MIGSTRKYRIIPVAILAALAWGFAVPIVHLACGMSVGKVDVLGEVVAAPDHHADAHAASTHSDVPAQTSASDASDQAILECCLVDAGTDDRRAPLPVLTMVPSAPTTSLDVTPVAPKTPIALFRGDADASPPIAFRLLFSVFLI